MSKQESVTSNLPALQKVSEVGIPTKKLNTIQQKNYREYADKVYENVKRMLGEIRKEVLAKFEIENQDKIRKEIISELGVEVYAEKIGTILKKAKDANSEALKVASDYDNKIQKLQSEKEAKVTTIKSEKMYPLIDEYNELRSVLTKARNKNDQISNPLSNDLRISTAKEYAYDEYELENEDDNQGYSYGRKPNKVKTVLLEYPALTVEPIMGFKAHSFINAAAVRNRLDEKMAPAIAEFQIAEVKLENMGQAVKEVMMFDEERMDEAFTKLFQFRDDIQQKHLQIVRKINFNSNEGE